MAWLGMRLGIGVRRSQRQRRDRVTCHSSPGATSSDSCTGTLPTDCCRESITPADISTGALLLTIGSTHANGSPGASPTGSCAGDTQPTDICLEVLHADCIGSSQAVSGSPEVVSGNPPPDSGSPSADFSVPRNNGCVDVPPADAHRGQPVGATSDREDDSDLQLPGNKAFSHKSRKSRKSAGAKKSGTKKTTKKGTNKSHIDSDLRTGTASQPYCYEDCVLNGKPGLDMIRCSLSMKWFHISCYGEEATYSGVWSCISCRKVPSLLSDLKSEIVNLNTHLNNVLTNEETLKDEIRRLRSENGKLKQKVVILETNNGDLKKVIETMSDITTEKEQLADTHSSATQHPNQPTAGFPALNICTSNRYAALASVTEVPPAGGRAPVLDPSHANGPLSPPLSPYPAGPGRTPSPAHHRDCDRKLHCARCGATGTRWFLWDHRVRVPRAHGTSNQRPHTPHPRQWRHGVGSRHKQYWISDRRTVYGRIIPSNWQCCSQTKWKSRHHRKNSASTWQTTFEQ